MPCGGCGGGDIRVAPRKSMPAAPSRVPVGIQRELRPKSLKRVILSNEASKPTKPDRSKLPKLTRLSRNRALNTRLCPICGASLSIEITGRTRQKRFRCSRCQKTYT